MQSRVESFFGRSGPATVADIQAAVVRLHPRSITPPVAPFEDISDESLRVTRQLCQWWGEQSYRLMYLLDEASSGRRDSFIPLVPIEGSLRGLTQDTPSSLVDDPQIIAAVLDGYRASTIQKTPSGNRFGSKTESLPHSRTA